MNKERFLLVVSGPSGSGKDTVVKRLMEKHENIQLSVSATTRAMRPGEREGVDYYYMTVPAFERLIAEGRILEHTSYCGNYYGTPRDQVEARLARGITVVLVIEVEGAANIKRQYPGCATVFVTPPSMEELERRLRARATDSEEAIQKRLARAHEEIACAASYDHQLINDDLDTCVEQLYQILRQHQSETADV